VIGVNFASAIFEGLSIVFLRRARNILAKAFPEERDVLLIIQITFMKLVISALAVLPFALAIEGWWNPLKVPRHIYIFTYINVYIRIYVARERVI
jgi:drug/metabolite transporter (DMT)-like permease